MAPRTVTIWATLQKVLLLRCCARVRAATKWKGARMKYSGYLSTQVPVVEKPAVLRFGPGRFRVTAGPGTRSSTYPGLTSTTKPVSTRTAR